MNDRFKQVTTIISLFFSFVALIISIIALIISHNSYDINKKEFTTDTVESLDVSVIAKEFEDFNLRGGNAYSSYRVKISICFINNSNS